MNTAAALPYAEQPSPGKGASVFLAVAVHALLLAFLFYGIRWQTQHPAAIEVELVIATPQPPQVEAPPPPTEPLPEPKPEPVAKVEPEPPPPPPKPEIAVKEKEKPKPVPPKPKPKPPSDFSQKQAVDQELKQIAARKSTDLANAAAAEELSQLKAAQAASARSKAIADYMAKIRGKIKSNIVLPIDIKGNPEAIFDVVQLPSGEILSVRLKKSSSHPGYDGAVERAILKSSPLPKPAQGELFSRELELKFRPQED